SSWSLLVEPSTPAVAGQPPRPNGETALLDAWDEVRFASYKQARALRIRLDEPAKQSPGEGLVSIDWVDPWDNSQRKSFRLVTPDPRRAPATLADARQSAHPDRAPATLEVRGLERPQPMRALVACRFRAEVVEKKKDPDLRAISLQHQ